MDVFVQLLGVLGDLLAPTPFRIFWAVIVTMLLILVVAILNRNIEPISSGVSLTTSVAFVSA